MSWIISEWVLSVMLFVGWLIMPTSPAIEFWLWVSGLAAGAALAMTMLELYA